MLEPKKLKFRKWHRRRGKGKGVATRGNALAFGDYGLKSLERHELSARQIEAARKAVSPHLKKTGKMWIRIFPHKPITAKAAEVPMGAGKGTVEYYVATVKPGTIIFEISGITEDEAKAAFRLASHKLPVSCKFITAQ